MAETKWTRCSFTLSDEVNEKLKKLQAELMLEVEGTISKATIINGVLEAGLKQPKSHIKEAILKHREEREY